MNKITSIIAGLLLVVSAGIFADEHTAAALEHARAAVTEARAGDAPKLVEHATVALEHAKAEDAVAKRMTKINMDAAVKSLEQAIKYGKEDDAKMAVRFAEEAVGHLEASNK